MAKTPNGYFIEKCFPHMNLKVANIYVLKQIYVTTS
jgi:hypothetical protein